MLSVGLNRRFYAPELGKFTNIVLLLWGDFFIFYSGKNIVYFKLIKKCLFWTGLFIRQTEIFDGEKTKSVKQNKACRK